MVAVPAAKKRHPNYPAENPRVTTYLRAAAARVVKLALKARPVAPAALAALTALKVQSRVLAARVVLASFRTKARMNVRPDSARNSMSLLVDSMKF